MDANSLPPCRAELLNHLRRSASAVGRHRLSFIEQEPLEGWEIVDGRYEIVWFSVPQLPEVICPEDDTDYENEELVLSSMMKYLILKIDNPNSKFVLLLASVLSTRYIFDGVTNFVENGTIVYNKEIELKKYTVWAFFEVFGIDLVIPAMALIILNGAIWLHIKNTKNTIKHQLSKDHLRRRAKTMRILFLIVFTFILCSFLPRLVYDVIAALYFVPYHWTRPIVNFFIILNSSVNIFIYCYSSADFRRNSKEIKSRSMSTIFMSISSRDCSKKLKHRSTEITYM